MHVRWALASVVLLVACAPPSAGECVMLVGRQSIDDALASLADGQTLCLPAGEVGPPSAPIARSITIRGARDASGALASTISGPAGACLVARGVDSGEPLYPSIDASAVVVTSGAASVTLDSLIVSGCTYGVVARAGHTRLTNVQIASVLVTTLIDGAASLEVQGGTFTSGTRRPDGSGPGVGTGVLAGTAASVLLGDLEIDGNGEGLGVHGRPRTLTIHGGELHNLSFALAIDDTSDTARVVEITGTHVHGLAPLVFSGASMMTGSLLAGGSVTIDSALVEGNGNQSIGLQLQGVDHAVVRGTTFMGHDLVSLSSFGSHVSLEAGNAITIPASSTGQAVGIASQTDMTSARASTLSFASGGVALTSTAAANGVHIAVLDATTTAMGAGISLSGGALGVYAGGSATVMLSGAGFTTTGTTNAAIAAHDTVTLMLDSLVLAPAADSLGITVENASSLHGTSLVVNGGRFAVQAVDHAALSIDHGTLTGATQAGIYVTSDAAGHHVGDVHVESAAVGVVIGGAGVHVRVEGATIENSMGSGAEAHAGAQLTVVSTAIRSAHGAALAFIDSSGFIAGSMLSNTGTRADGRADDVRVVSTDGAMHSVDFGDDGDGVITTADLNFIVLDPARTCVGQCTVVMSDGAGAQAIVRPNCLNGSASSADVHTLVDQMGGTFLIPMAQAWTGQFAGPGSNLGLVPGVAASAVGLPVPAVPPRIAAAIPPGA
jgi:hypothetical protein